MGKNNDMGDAGIRAAQEAERRAQEARNRADQERLKRLAEIEAKMRERKG